MNRAQVQCLVETTTCRITPVATLQQASGYRVFPRLLYNMVPDQSTAMDSAATVLQNASAKILHRFDRRECLNRITHFTALCPKPSICEVNLWIISMLQYVGVVLTRVLNFPVDVTRWPDIGPSFSALYLSSLASLPLWRGSVSKACDLCVVESLQFVVVVLMVPCDPCCDFVEVSEPCPETAMMIFRYIAFPKS